MMPWVLLNHAAYKTLKPSSAQALPYFLGKPKKSFAEPEYYDTPFSFSYKEGKKLGFAYSTFAGIITDLMNHGIIDPVDKGGLRGDSKSCNKFKLSKRWEKHGTHDFNVVNWQEFQPPIPTARNSRI